MKFLSKSNDVVWDAERNCVLATFINGECEVKNERTINILKYLGYSYEGGEEVEPIKDNGSPEQGLGKGNKRTKKH